MSAAIVFRVAEREEAIPFDLWTRCEGPRPDPETFWSRDGATLAPDKPLFPVVRGFDPHREDRREVEFRQVNIAAAFIIHDYHYSAIATPTREWRRHADRIFARNLGRCALFYGASPADALGMGRHWYHGLRVGGRRAFQFAEGERDYHWLARFFDRSPGMLTVAEEDLERPYASPENFVVVAGRAV